MSKFKRFSDFVEAKKQDLIDAKDGLAGEDYDGPLSSKPPQEPTKGKYDKPLPYQVTGALEGGVVYTAPDDGEKKGLAFDASPGMTPQTSSLGKNVEGKSRQIKSKKKLTTEEFIDATREMNNSEFANYVLESHDTSITTITDLFGNEFTPDPSQTIQYLAGLMLGNPVYMSRFLREIKRRDGLNDLMSELMDHSDVYEHIVDQLEEPEVGIGRCGIFAKTLNDRYMKAYDNFDFDELDESVGPDIDTLMGTPNKSQGGGNPNYSKTPSTPNPNYKDQSVYAINPDSNPMGAQSMHNPVSTGGNVMGGATNPQFAGQPPMTPKKMSDGSERPKLKESAGFHLINELSTYPHFKGHMKSRCADC